MALILIVDDEPAIRAMLEIALRKEGHRVESAATLAAARQKLGAALYDVVISDLRLESGEEGLELLRECQRLGSDTAFILVTGHHSLESAIEAIKIGGAADYLIKGPDLVDQVLRAARRSLDSQRMQRENQSLKRQLAQQQALDTLIGASPAMERVRESIRHLAASESTVMIRGESGTGKEVAARALHQLSPRRDHAFISINCGALPEGLLESELFGCIKGAYTGAWRNRRGLFEAADGGTLLLDEIGDMPLPMQVALLRVLQERQVRPLGSDTQVPVDVRVLVATHADLEQAVREGRFREDLYYRINVLPLELPPLRQRREDIPLLAQHFLERFARQLDKPVKRFSTAGLERLQAHDWPGNVRQLEHTVERAVALAAGEEAEPDGLASYSPARGGEAAPSLPDSELPPEGLEARLASYERHYLSTALAQAGGVRTRAAELLGLSYRSFRHHAAKYGI